MAPDLLGRLPPVGSKSPSADFRRKRMELGKYLPWRGLWPKELAGMEQWGKKTPEERRQFIVEGKKTQFPPVSQR